MTNEEAIKGLLNVKMQMCEETPFTEAIDLAVKALDKARTDEREKIKKFAEEYIKEHYFPNSRASEIVKYFVEGVVEEYGKVVEE